MKKNYVLTFTREAGAAAMFIPIINNIKSINFINCAKDYAADMYNANKIKFNKVNKLTDIQSLLTEDIKLIFTSAVSLPYNDMTEKLLWELASKKNIKSAAILDTWQNYALRFSGNSESEYLKYIPDYIFVMDDIAKNEMVKLGINKEKIIITGQPAFDDIFNMTITDNEKQEISNNIFNNDYPTILFISESYKKDAALNIGFDEETILYEILNILNKIKIYNDIDFNLLVKLHPANSIDDLKKINFTKYPFKIKFIMKEYSPHKCILISDLVLGMISTLLIDSILLKKPTVSFQIGTNREDLHILTKNKIIDKIMNKEEGYKIIINLLTNSKFKNAYLKKQEQFSLNKNAVSKIEKELFRLLEK